MIECTLCGVWLHDRCKTTQVQDSSNEGNYLCPLCSAMKDQDTNSTDATNIKQHQSLEGRQNVLDEILNKLLINEDTTRLKTFKDNHEPSSECKITHNETHNYTINETPLPGRNKSKPRKSKKNEGREKTGQLEKQLAECKAHISSLEMVN